MRKLKKFIILTLALSIGILFIGCEGDEITLPENTDALTSQDLESIYSLIDSLNTDGYAEINYGNVVIDENFNYNEISNLARVDIKDYGSFYICLLPDVAPTTVNNFKKLALEGFYNGLVFHRVIKDFMIEGGEQDADGVIHDSEMIFGEFSDNNFTNNLSHKRGIVSMSRKNIPDSAMGSFFITCADSPQLDGRYAAFGYIAAGMDVVDAIQNSEVGANNNPTEPIIIEKIQFMTITGE